MRWRDCTISRRKRWCGFTPAPNTWSTSSDSRRDFHTWAECPPRSRRRGWRRRGRLVPAGSVAIGGDHTGIYPVASPGGWRIIGRTPLEIFRADRDSADAAADGRPCAIRGDMTEIRVVSPGFLTTCRISGGTATRISASRLRAPPTRFRCAGAIGWSGNRRGRRRAGNDAGGRGFRVLGDANGRAHRVGIRRPTRPGFALSKSKPETCCGIGPTRSGARCYLCVRGGIAVPLVLGSASTHLTDRHGRAATDAA